MDKWIIKGDIKLTNLNIKVIDKLSIYISTSFEDLMSMDTDTLYISGNIEGDILQIKDFFNQFLVKISSFIDISEPTSIIITNSEFPIKYEYYINENAIGFFEYEYKRCETGEMVVPYS